MSSSGIVELLDVIERIGPGFVPCPIDLPAGPRRPTALRFSLAGVQLKFSAIRETRGGLTIPASGVGGSWIVMLPSAQFPGVPENEYSMMTLARLIGLDVPALYRRRSRRSTICLATSQVSKGIALAIERFD